MDLVLLLSTVKLFIITKLLSEIHAILAREKEVDILYEKLFEEKILGNLTEDRFKKLSYKYEDEQAELKQKIKHLKQIVADEKRHEMNADGFLQLVQKYTDIQTLTLEVLHEFVDRIVVTIGNSFLAKLCRKWRFTIR